MAPWHFCTDFQMQPLIMLCLISMVPNKALGILSGFADSQAVSCFRRLSQISVVFLKWPKLTTFLGFVESNRWSLGTLSSHFLYLSWCFLLFEFTRKRNLSRKVATRRIKTLVAFVSVCIKDEQPEISQQRL